MASPHVAGVAALVLAAEPGLTTSELKSRIMSTVDPIQALSGITVTGGRLNAYKAVIGLTGNATVSGQVTDNDTGSPINRAFVILLNRTTREKIIVKSDRNGGYVADVPPASKYVLVVVKKGYVAHIEIIGSLTAGDDLIRNVQLTPRP
jgi:subtilisin family serine protease